MFLNILGLFVWLSMSLKNLLLTLTLEAEDRGLALFYRFFALPLSTVEYSLFDCESSLTAFDVLARLSAADLNKFCLPDWVFFVCSNFLVLCFWKPIVSALASGTSNVISR